MVFDLFYVGSNTNYINEYFSTSVFSFFDARLPLSHFSILVVYSCKA